MRELFLAGLVATVAGCITTPSTLTYSPEYSTVGTAGTRSLTQRVESCGGYALGIPFGDAGYAETLGIIERRNAGWKVASVRADETWSFYLLVITRCLDLTATLVTHERAQPALASPPGTGARTAPPPPKRTTCKRAGNVTVEAGARAAEVALDISEYVGCRGVVETASGRKVVGLLARIDDDKLVLIQQSDGSEMTVELTTIRTLGAVP